MVASSPPRLDLYGAYVLRGAAVLTLGKCDRFGDVSIVGCTESARYRSANEKSNTSGPFRLDQVRGQTRAIEERATESVQQLGKSSTGQRATALFVEASLQEWLKDAQINRDSNLRLQYLAGLGLNLYQADVIYADMLRFVSKMPDDLFVASVNTRPQLYSALRQQGK